MALWTSQRANQVAQKEPKEGKKLLSYLLDSPKSLYIHQFAITEFVICLLVLEKLRAFTISCDSRFRALIILTYME